VAGRPDATASGKLTCGPGTGPATAISTNCRNATRKYFSKFPYLSDINEIQNLNISNYNSLQVTLTQRSWHGLNYILGYVYSHCLEMGSDDWNRATLPSNVLNPRADYGDCLTDVRHSLTWSLSYALPGKRGFGQMIEGWRVNSIVKYQTALPWNVADTKDNISGMGELEDRWDFFGNPSDFSGLKYAGVPYYTGTTNPACVAEAAALNANYAPPIVGWTAANAGFNASLAKFGCFARTVARSCFHPPTAPAAMGSATNSAASRSGCGTYLFQRMSASRSDSAGSFGSRPSTFSIRLSTMREVRRAVTTPP
jgi:hypothetical protein